MSVSKSLACLLLILGSGPALRRASGECLMFAPAMRYGVGDNPLGVAIGDLDGDGELDLATVNFTLQNVSVLLNSGDGSFTEDMTYGVGDEPRSVAIGDLDGDGDADLAVSNRGYPPSVSVLLNNGDATFASDVLYDTGSQPWHVAMGDLDADGDIDLAVTNSGTDDVSVLLNNGDGTFAADVTYGVGVEPRTVAIGDLDGDGDADLAVANAFADNVSVLLNNGDGSFAGDATYGAGNAPHSLAIADLDADGDADLAVTNSGSFGRGGSISVLMNNGDGTFTLAADMPFEDGNIPKSVVIGDLDGDGDADLAVGKSGYSEFTEKVSVWLNDGDGIFAADVTYDAGNEPEALAIGDLDGDGVVDLAVLSWDADSVSVLLNRGDLSDLPLSIHNLTQGTDHPLIQCAVNEAQDGDEIEVDPGTYVENIDFKDKDITLRSINPQDLDAVELTIIDGGGLDTVVTLSAGEISGFTITGGVNTGTEAGGVHATGTAVVSHNVITGNVAEEDGGGVAATDSAVVRNNRITFNEAGDVGGGVNAKGDSLVIDNYIAFNEATSGGGGLGAVINSTIRNNTIVFNSTSGDGGGVIAGLSPVLLNNIVAFSTDGVGIHVTGSDATADYNCVFGNSGGNYGGDAVAGPNDLNIDPELDADELHLQVSSPCVDAGDPDLIPLTDETDIDGEARIHNDRVDIGADEVAICEGDANGDGTVDPLDSGFVLARFGCPVGTGDPGCDQADQNGDGAVDPLDSGFVLARFGPCE